MDNGPHHQNLSNKEKTLPAARNLLNNLEAKDHNGALHLNLGLNKETTLPVEATQQAVNLMQPLLINQEKVTERQPTLEVHITLEKAWEVVDWEQLVGGEEALPTPNKLIHLDLTIPTTMHHHLPLPLLLPLHLLLLENQEVETNMTRSKSSFIFYHFLIKLF